MGRRPGAEATAGSAGLYTRELQRSGGPGTDKGLCRGPDGRCERSRPAAHPQPNRWTFWQGEHMRGSPCCLVQGRTAFFARGAKGRGALRQARATIPAARPPLKRCAPRGWSDAPPGTGSHLRQRPCPSVRCAPTPVQLFRLTSWHRQLPHVAPTPHPFPRRAPRRAPGEGAFFPVRGVRGRQSRPRTPPLFGFPAPAAAGPGLGVGALVEESARASPKLAPIGGGGSPMSLRKADPDEQGYQQPASVSRTERESEHLQVNACLTERPFAATVATS